MSIADRLKNTRIHNGFPSATEAAEKHGWPLSTYLAHENGTRGIPLKVVGIYAKAFHCDLIWLTFGTNKLPSENRKPRRYIEHAIQVELMNIFRTSGVPGAVLFAIPNGGARNVVAAKRLKDEGVTAGVPDMWARGPGGQSFWLELKPLKKGVKSKEQIAMHLALTELDERVFTAHGLHEALEILKREGVISSNNTKGI